MFDLLHHIKAAPSAYNILVFVLLRHSMTVIFFWNQFRRNMIFLTIAHVISVTIDSTDCSPKQGFKMERNQSPWSPEVKHNINLPPWKGPFYRPKPDPWFIWSTCREEHKIWQAFILIRGRISETTVAWVDSCKTSQRWYFEPIICKWFNLRILIRYHLIVVDRDERDRKQWMVLRLMYVE